MKKIVTHSDRFHTDDVFAIATLSLLYGEGGVEIIRSRDKEVIDSADIVVDVGHIFDPETERFDHHQTEGAGERENGISYASFGLVWRNYGRDLCTSEEVWKMIDKKMAQPIDAMDNGTTIYESNFEDVYPYVIQNVINTFSPSWKEEIDFDQQFIKAVDLAKFILEREILKAEHGEEAKSKIEEVYESSENKQIIIFDKDTSFGDGVTSSVLSKYSEPIFMILYAKNDDTWKAKAVPEGGLGYNNRGLMPKEWRGKDYSELAKVSDISDAVFCHRTGFLAVAKSKESAIKMAEIAVQKML